MSKFQETKTCPDCMHDGECDRAIGKCICPPGFIGEFCEEGCGGNAFGKDCMGHCSGQKGGCSGLMLCVPVIGCNCASGFTGEHCNVECSKGKYGPNCSFQCGKCLPSSQCDIFTGVCHDGCLQGYFPPLCNTTYSYLMKPPVVTRIDPRKITYEITSTSENIAGVGEPRYFQAQIQEQGSSNWSSRTPSLFHQQAVKHVSVISRLQPGVDYRLRVVLIDNDGSYFDNDLIIPHTNVTTICEEALKPTYEIKANWKTRFEIETQWQYYPNVEEPCPLLHYRVYLREEWRQYLYCVTEETKVAIPNRSPDFRYAVQVQAVTSQGPSAISHSVIVRPVPGAPSRVLRLRSKQLNSTGIEVSWARPRHTSRNIKLYIVKYECLRYLACKAHINCSESYGQFKTERLTIRLLNLYSHAQYLIKIAAYTVEMGPWSSVKATTSFRAPEIAPKAANVPIIFRNVTSLKVTWQPPEDCKLFHGFPLYYYYMLFEKHQEIRLISDGNVSQPPLNFTSLQPYTAYILRVYLVVTGGLKNPNHKLEILIRTTGSGLSPIHDLVADSVTSTSVSVHWKYPEARRNFVDKYIVIFVCVRYLSCEKSVQECSNNGTLDTLQTKIVLTNLEPYARYEISVAAFNGDMSDFVTLKINTNSSRPEIAPREDPNYLPRSGNSWIAFRWLPPSKCHLIRGPLFGYCYRVVKEDIKKVFNFNDQLMSHTSPQDLLITRGLFANVSNLTPFTPFKVEIGILNDEDRRSCQMDFTYNFTIWTRSSEKMGFDQLVAYKKGKHYIGLRWRKKADHSDQSSFVNVKLETGHSKPIRQRLKSRVCSIWSEYSCLDIGGLEPNVTYNISLRYYNSLSSSNNIPQSLTVRTVEEASGPPSFIKLLKKSHDSVIIEWGHPNISNGHIRSFKIISEHVGSFRSSLCCEESKSAVIPAFNIENASYVVKITELKPASEYYVTVSATTILPGDPVSITIYTKPGVPKISRPPYVLRDTITDTTAEVMLYPTDDLNEGPIWVYFIMICGEEEIEEDEGEIDPVFAIVKTAVNRTGFIVLTLSEEELSGPREVSIGSGEEFLGIFGFITNQPLSPNTNYTVLQIVMLDYMGSRSFGLAESEPFITKP